MTVLDELREENNRALAEKARWPDSSNWWDYATEPEAVAALLDIAEAARRVLAPGAIVSVSNGTRAVVQTSQALADLGEAVARLDGRALLGGDA